MFMKVTCRNYTATSLRPIVDYEMQTFVIIAKYNIFSVAFNSFIYCRLLTHVNIGSLAKHDSSVFSNICSATVKSHCSAVEN